MYIPRLGSILITIMIIVSDGTEHILFELLAGWLPDEPKRSLFAFPFLNEKSFRTYEEEVNQGIPPPHFNYFISKRVHKLSAEKFLESDSCSSYTVLRLIYSYQK